MMKILNKAYWLNLIVVVSFFSNTSYAQEWINIGPQFGGYLRDFAFHPSRSGVILLGGDDSAGIWKSEDGGETWRLVSEEIPNMSGWHIEYDKDNVQTVYACDLYNRYGMAKSSDGGETWTSSMQGLNSIKARTVSKIAILNQDTLFISTGLERNDRTGDGIYMSIDGGQSWRKSGLQGLTCPAIVITQTNRLIVGTQGQGLKFSDDKGKTWLDHQDISATAIFSQIEVKDSFLVALSSSNGIYVSSDNGMTFNNIGSGGFDVTIGSTQPTLSIYSSALVKAEYDYINKTTPIWTSINKAIISNDTVLNMGIGAKGDTIIVGQLANARLFISSNKGESWDNTTSSPSANNINDIAIDPNDSQHIFASLVISNALGIDKECLFESRDGGVSWSRKGPKESALKIKFHPTSSDTLLCGTFTGGLYLSSDGGTSWNNLKAATRIVEIAYNPFFPNEILVAEIDDINLTQQLLKSSDGGNHFDSVAPVAVSQIAYIPNSDSIVAGVNTAGSFNGVFLSTDRGDSWESFALSGTPVKTVIYHERTIYAGSEEGQLYRISHSGLEDITGGWEQLTEITNIYFLDDTLFVGLNGAEHDRDSSFINHGGVWYSIDHGQTWVDISAGLSCSQLFGNNVMTEWNNKLLIGTYGGGFFRLNPLPVGIADEYREKQTLNVYPNPVTKRLFIKIPETLLSKNVEYQIINVAGKIVQSGKSSFKQILRLDLKELQSGVYILILDGEKQRFHQKIIKY